MLSDQVLVDVAVSEAGKPQSIAERARAALRVAEKTLKAKPDDLDARMARARRSFRLGRTRRPSTTLMPSSTRSTRTTSTRSSYRAIALARLGQEAGRPGRPGQVPGEDAPERSRLYLAAIVAAELGEGADKAIEALEAALRKEPEDADLRYDAACAFALASKAVGRYGQGKGRDLAARALALLRAAVQDGDAELRPCWTTTLDFDPLRDDPAFAELMKPDTPTGAMPPSGPPMRGFEAVTALRPRPRRAPAGVAGSWPPRAIARSPGRSAGPRPRARRCRRLGLAPPAGHGGGQGPARRAPGAGGGRPGAPGQGRGGLAPAAAQRRPPAAQLHRQLAEPPGGRPARRRGGTRPDRSRRPVPPRAPGQPGDGRHALPPRDLAAAGA